MVPAARFTVHTPPHPPYSSAPHPSKQSHGWCSQPSTVFWNSREKSRNPRPPPPPHLDDNAGDDSEDNDADVFLHAGVPSVTVGGTSPLMLFCPEVPHAQCFCLFQRCYFVDFRNLYRPLSFYAHFRLGALKVSPRMWLIDFLSGLLSKGPEERADGDRDHHLRATEETHTPQGTTREGYQAVGGGGVGRGAGSVAPCMYIYIYLFICLFIYIHIFIL